MIKREEIVSFRVVGAVDGADERSLFVLDRQQEGFKNEVDLGVRVYQVCGIFLKVQVRL